MDASNELILITHSPQNPLCVTAIAVTRLPRSAGETTVGYILSITASANSLVFTSVGSSINLAKS